MNEINKEIAKLEADVEQLLKENELLQGHCAILLTQLKSFEEAFKKYQKEGV